MKLDCEVVKDLYVLYKENELSLKVKTAVEEHLNQCEECRDVYQSERDFTDIIKQDIDKPSEKMDKKMFSRLKLLRMKIALVLIIAVSASIFGSSYSKSREYLRRDSERYLENVNHILVLLQGINHEGTSIENERIFNRDIDNYISNANENYEVYKRSLNFIEKKNLEDYYNRSSFELSVKSLIFTLNSRSNNGSWSNEDEKAYTMLLEELKSMQNILITEKNKLGNIFFKVKTSDIHASLNKVNQLALSYIRYNKFPDQIKQLSKDDIKKRLEFLFNVKGEKFIFEDRGDVECFFQMRVANDYAGYSGIIDKYTGRVIELDDGVWKSSGELISVEKVKTDVTTFLKKNFGEKFDFQLKELGINHNITANDGTKFYCFDVQFMYNGYKIGKSFNMRCEARTGKISLEGIHNWIVDSDLDIKNENLDIKARYSYEEALKNAKLLDTNKDQYKYNDMFFMKSRITGKYELVYEYKTKDSYGNESYLYINAVTGKREYQSYGYNYFSY